MKFKLDKIMDNAMPMAIAAGGGGAAAFIDSDKFPVKNELLQTGIIVVGGLLTTSDKDFAPAGYGAAGYLGGKYTKKFLGLSGYDDTDINGIMDKLDQIEGEEEGAYGVDETVNDSVINDSVINDNGDDMNF